MSQAQLAGGVLIYSTRAQNAFAQLRENGSVVTWGEPSSAPGGDSSCVQEQLQSGVQHITSTIGAFAAKKEDGSVVTWGAKEHGGDSNSLKAQLAGRVHHIYSNEKAFAAKKEDGIIIAWGDCAAQAQLDGVAKAVAANEKGTAHACLKHDGSVITWGI